MYLFITIYDDQFGICGDLTCLIISADWIVWTLWQRFKHWGTQGSPICIIATKQTPSHWSGRWIVTAPSIDNDVPSGGRFHAPNTNLWKMRHMPHTTVIQVQTGNIMIERTLQYVWMVLGMDDYTLKLPTKEQVSQKQLVMVNYHPESVDNK